MCTLAHAHTNMVCFSFLAALRTTPQRKIVPHKTCSIEGSTAHKTEASTAHRSRAGSFPVFLDLNIECNDFFGAISEGATSGYSSGKLWSHFRSEGLFYFCSSCFFPPKQATMVYMKQDGARNGLKSYTVCSCMEASVCLCVTVFGSTLHCVAVCCRVLQYAAICCNVMQCVAAFCSVLQPHMNTVCSWKLRYVVCYFVWQYVALWCSVLQYAAMCCSVLPCVAASYECSMLVHRGLSMSKQ